MDTQDVIDQIISRFDFEKVRAYMLIRDWKIETEKTAQHVPTQEEIAEEAKFLLENVVQSKNPTLLYSSEYALVAWKSGDETLHLCFYIELKKSFIP